MDVIKLEDIEALKEKDRFIGELKSYITDGRLKVYDAKKLTDK